MAPKPLQQISHSGKKVVGDPSSQKFATAEVSSNPFNNLVDIVTDRVIAHNAKLTEMAFDLRNQLMKGCQANLLQDVVFKKAKESLQLQAPILKLPAPSEQGTRTSTKRKISEVEEVDLAVSPNGAKPSGKKLFKIVAKTSSAKKAKVVEVVPDSSIIEVESLEEELDDTATLSNLVRKIDEQKQVMSGVIEAQEAEDQRIAREYKEAKQLAAALKAKAKAEDAERKRLEAEMEKKRQADKAKDERIAEIEKKLEIKKKEKAQADKKK